MDERKSKKPITKNVASDPHKYFREYYHAHNAETQCECGQTVKQRGMHKHLTKSKKHTLLIQLKNQNSKEEVEIFVS